MKKQLTQNMAGSGSIIPKGGLLGVAAAPKGSSKTEADNSDTRISRPSSAKHRGTYCET